MAHDIFRLATKYLYNKPLLSTQTQVEELIDYVESRGTEHLSIVQNLESKAEQGSLGENDIAIIPIQGPLTYSSTGWEGLCGGMSYELLCELTGEAIKEGFSTIVYDVDSGGGEAYGTFETARDIQRMTKEAGVKTVAYIDGYSASAAYGLTAAMDEVIINPQGKAGSIGVVTRLRDTSEKDQKDGVKDIYVYAGDSKIPYDAEGKFSEPFINDLQDSVDVLYEDFLDHVSGMRGIEKEAVRSTQARMFSAKDSLELGLVDSIMERNEFADYLADIREKGDTMSLLNFQLNSKEEDMKLEEMQKELDSANQEKEQALSELATSKEAFAELSGTVESLTKENAELTSVIGTMKEEKEQAKQTDRKEKLSKVVAEDKLSSVFEAVKSLEDSAFDSVLDGYQAAANLIDNSELMGELGVDGEGSEHLDQAEEKSNLLMTKIKQRKA